MTSRSSGAIAAGEASTAHLVSILRAWFGPEHVESAAIEWSGLLSLAELTKTTGLLRASCSKAGVAIPPDVDEQLGRAEEHIVRTNTANLGWTIRVADALRQAGVRTVVLKGAMRSEEVYGSIDKRISHDIDLLVPEQDYRRAGAVLEEAGFLPIVPATDAWWHDFLGESPYIHQSGSGPIIDLHHQVQQPGGPYPLDLDSFLSCSQTVLRGGKRVSVLSPAHGVLLAAIGFGKAVRAGAPWLVYAHELAYLSRQWSQKDRISVCSLAQGNGVARLLRDALTAAELLFISRERSPSTSIRSSAVGQASARAFARSGNLWRWCDGPLLARMRSFLSGEIKAMRSERAYRRSSSRSGTAGRVLFTSPGVRS